MESKKVNLRKQRVKWWLPEDGGGKWDKCFFKSTDHQVVNKPQISNALWVEDRQKYCSITVKLRKRLERIVPTIKKEESLCNMIELVDITKMMIFLQYIDDPNQHVVHLKFIQCYMSNIF